MVGANGFEPSTSWSRTRHLNPINALSGVAYGTRSVISPLQLYLTCSSSLGLTPVVRGDSCAHLHHYYRVARQPCGRPEVGQTTALSAKDTIAGRSVIRNLNSPYAHLTS